MARKPVAGRDGVPPVGLKPGSVPMVLPDQKPDVLLIEFHSTPFGSNSSFTPKKTKTRQKASRIRVKRNRHYSPNLCKRLEKRVNAADPAPFLLAKPVKKAEGASKCG